MADQYDIWKMLAGVAFFLLAMSFMESSLRSLAGRKFKLFLKKQTTNKVKAIGGGAIVTALLQSSSIVNLLVLSLVGAGVVQMQNALALMLGSNLGTTFTSWLVVTLGFGLSIEHLMLPVTAIAGICMAFMNTEHKLYNWTRFIFSLAFLFVALSYIKTGMEGWVRQTDLSFFTNYPVIIFLLLGIALTTVIQSSSATIALTLSALFTGAITLYMGMAIVLGSEIGTTIKLFLASAKGSVAKKQVALGNFLFNAITVLIVFICLHPIHHFISDILQISDNLYALVFFQSMVNVVCVIIFLPFLKVFGHFLKNRFSQNGDEKTFISKVSATDVDLAMDALETETKYFINHVIDYSLDSFEVKPPVGEALYVYRHRNRMTVHEKYDFIKQLHGEMHNFCLKVQNKAMDKADTERLNQLLSCIRNSMYAAKSIRDAQFDIEQIRNSSNDTKYEFYIGSREKLLDFYHKVMLLVNAEKKESAFDNMVALHQSVIHGYSETMQMLYKENMMNRVSEMEISMLINFNRELFTSFKSIIYAVKDYLLTTSEGEYFDSLPGFIR